MKIYSSIFVLVLSITWLGAQNDIQFSQFMNGKLLYNSAYAGNFGHLALTAMYRSQWTDIEGAPESFYLSAHTGVLDNRCGLGMTITHDKIGFVNQTHAQLSYAYRIPLDDESTLSVGINAAMEFANINMSAINTVQGNDMSVMSFGQDEREFNYGIGLLYSRQHFYAGVSVPRMRVTHLNTASGNFNNASSQIAYYFMTGFEQRLTQQVKLKPSLLVSYVPNAPMDFTVNAGFEFVDRVFTGISYRLDDSVHGILQYKLNKQLNMGFAYDFTVSELKSYAGSSFEFLMQYHFDFEQIKIKNVRFF